MTEDEAKTKWCPFVNAVGTNAKESQMLGNRAVDLRTSDTGHAFAKCIGSACMAWRGKESAAFKTMAEAEYRHSGKRLTAGPDEMEGFCGLAGAPQ